MAHRPIALTVLGALQFLAFGVVCVVLLGDGTLDGELSAGDIALAVGVAILGAIVVGITWNGSRVAWWFELALAAVAIVWGLVTGAADDLPGYALAACGAVSGAVVALPSSRQWFLRPVQ
jgi:hypothetical protein